jgi:16S rRNA (guanine527-N7)-methyltransferase
MTSSLLPPDRIATGARALGLALPDAVFSALARYGALLLRWNRSINLLARGADADDVLERHLLDSLALLRLAAPAGRVLDVGSGAGLPGVVLGLAAPDIAALTLLEPTAKRVTFLRAALRELSLSRAVARAERLEDLGPDERFDWLVSRATFAPAEWVRRAAPYRAPDGRIVVMLSQVAVTDVAAAAAAAGLRVLAEDGFALPGSGAARRNVLVGA